MNLLALAVNELPAFNPPQRPKRRRRGRPNLVDDILSGPDWAIALLKENLLRRMEEMLAKGEATKVLDAAFKVIEEEMFPNGAPNAFYVSRSISGAARSKKAQSVQRYYTHRDETRMKNKTSLDRLDERVNKTSLWKYPRGILPSSAPGSRRTSSENWNGMR